MDCNGVPLPRWVPCPTTIAWVRKPVPPPKPVDVPYNDWRRVVLRSPAAFTPALGVSVVMPCHRTPRAVLRRTLAALEGQTYPRDLMEVVIVDDGSEPPLALPPSPLNVRLVRQARRGHGVARARNTGVRAAVHPIILFLDGDSLQEAGWMAAHARWHHSISDVLTVGFRAHVAVDDLDAETIRRRTGTVWELCAGRPADPPAHENEHYMVRTNELTARADDLFRAVVGGNFGVGRNFYWAVGGSDETFTRWGFDEEEFAWRAYVQGALLAPVRDALVWHQGRMAEGQGAKRRSARAQRGKVAQLIAHPAFRGAGAGRIYQVPRCIVTIQVGCCSAEQVIAATTRVLTDRLYDLVVRIEVAEAENHEYLQRLRDAFDADARVRVAPMRAALDEFPASPLHVTLPASARAPHLVHRLHRALRDAVIATAKLPDGTEVTIARSWALHRARRTGRPPTAFGTARQLTRGQLGLTTPNAVLASTPSNKALDLPGRWRYVLHRTDDLHSLREAWWFVRWLARWGWRRWFQPKWTVPRHPPNAYAPPTRPSAGP